MKDRKRKKKNRNHKNSLPSVQTLIDKLRPGIYEKLKDMDHDQLSKSTTDDLNYLSDYQSIKHCIKMIIIRGALKLIVEKVVFAGGSRYVKVSENEDQLKTNKEEYGGHHGATESGNPRIGERDLISYRNNILTDIARLEILLEEKRARNNSPEISNEAAYICGRLCKGVIMDISIYREFIDELVDNNNSD